MKQQMRYRLGLDLGSSSIGWCMIRLNADNRPCAVIRMGVRIFPDGRNPKDGSSLAVTRRLARQARRRRDRLLRRKAKLLEALVRLGFFPADSKERKKLTMLDPYVLRRKGLDAPLSGPEFGRALFHINQRRGFKSNRKTDSRDQEHSLMKKAISELRDKIEKENCRTVGEWLARRHEQGLSVRARLRGRTVKDKAYDFYIDRSLIEQEFDTLWAVQQCFKPALFSEEARATLKDILLFQRPLKPVKPGRCTFYHEDERAPLALPSNQRFRIYQELNNLRLIDRSMTERPLLIEERDKLVNLLEKGNLTFGKIRRTLGLDTSISFNLESEKRTRLKGNATSLVLCKAGCFGDVWHQFSLTEQDSIVEKLLNEASEAELIRWLLGHSGIDRKHAEAIANVSLPEGFGMLGRRALEQILPELIRDVVTYDKAVTNAGFDSHSALSRLQQTGEILPSLPYYGEPLQRHVGFGSGEHEDPPEKRYGRIANPTVHIGLNELRKVVNALIARYGHPSEVIVEVARELRLSRKRKQEIERDQAARQKRNQALVADACQILGVDPEHIDSGKRRQLSQKMQLWTELNHRDVADRRCPYTGEQISIERLLSPEVEIEHILPFSMTLDDSLNNKTVALRRANREKGNRTPYDAFGVERTSGHDYEGILERARKMPHAKAWRFGPDAMQRWLRDEEDFLGRALNDTAYLSRIAREYLTLICPATRVIPGRMTAMMRGKFGLSRLLGGSPVKNRNDHRHHAIDAAVVAVTDQGLLQRFAEASASARKKQLDRLVEEMPLPWSSYREHVQRAVSCIRVSHRPNHGYQGALHEATAWGPREGGMVRRKERPEDGGPRTTTTKKSGAMVPVSSTNDPLRHGKDAKGKPKAYKAYLGGSNYCIEIVETGKGRWQGEVVTTYQAYQLVRQRGETEAVKRLRDPRLSQSGKPLVMRLMIGDMLFLDVDGQRVLVRVCQVKQNGQVVMAPHNEANVDSRSRNKDDPFRYIFKSPGSLQKSGARYVTVSPIGNMNIHR